nr:hypothetical protein [Tanacetum cinerariifolium]
MTIFWVDAFAYPASFLRHTSKSVSRDAVPKSYEFNAEHYATLVAYPAPFHKYPEPFLCLVGMSRNYTMDENNYHQFMCDDDEGGCLLLEMDFLSFIRTADPIKVRIYERQRGEDEPKNLETTIGRAEYGHSTSGGKGAGVQPISQAEEVVAEDVVPLQPRRQKKRKTIVVGGKSRSAVQRLLAGAALNAEVRGDPIPTFPFVTSSMSATPKREGEGHTCNMSHFRYLMVWFIAILGYFASFRGLPVKVSS